jgi:hypothetical protein
MDQEKISVRFMTGNLLHDPKGGDGTEKVTPGEGCAGRIR